MALDREWLATNGLGGYASGPVHGPPGRRYHGLLVAALPPPLGRMVMLNHLDERVRLPDGRDFVLGAEAERVAFHLDLGLPVWRYDLDGTVIEKRLHAPHGRNTVVVTYGSGEGAGPVLLELRPSVSFRPHGSPLEDVRRAYAL
ncbi:MAG: glycogen debranching enzyme N-terminal domain-containing protein, partial [Alphaproteobacteria bacterium]|nr:glycogen debranching enzyme N-terminal domain-containing protein [Alphaproteobacteria bacterium]